jgi:hypothetical protein
MYITYRLIITPGTFKEVCVYVFRWQLFWEKLFPCSGVFKRGKST